jgi:hypothetical protein
LTTALLVSALKVVMRTIVKIDNKIEVIKKNGLNLKNDPCAFLKIEFTESSNIM